MYDNQQNLQYQWQQDGNPIVLVEDPTRTNSKAEVTGSVGYIGTDLKFTNISVKHSGIYSCTVANDIGSITSEQVYIDVVIPDQEDFFYKNLVKNPNGSSDVEEWSGDSAFISSKLSNIDFKEASEVWRPDIFGYTKDMFWPRPYHLNTHYIKNSDLEENIMKEGSYFTRDKWEYIVNGGQRVVQSETEIDLTDLKDYIQGSIYGIEGVGAVFGCYIGNAISRYRATLLNVLVNSRTNKYALLPVYTRFHIINTLLAGVPELFEKVDVVIQEYDGETPLITRANGKDHRGYRITDEWTKHIQKSYGPIDYGVKYGIEKSEASDLKFVHIVNNNILFPDERYVPTYGQFVKFNRFLIDKLNYQTTKVKITITFYMGDILNETNPLYVDSGDVFEYRPWEWVVKAFKYPRQPDTFLSEVDENNNVNYFTVASWNKKFYNYEDSDINKWMTVLGKPRSMVTGFNFVAIPLETTHQNKTEFFKKTILAPLDKNISSTGLTYEYGSGDNESVGEYLRKFEYTNVDTGLLKATELGAQMAEFAAAGYDWEVVGINIEHELNIPTGRFDGPKGINMRSMRDYREPTTNGTWRYGDGVIPTSITKVSTYKLNKNTYNKLTPSSSVDYSQFNTPYGNEQIWQPYSLADLEFIIQSSQQQLPASQTAAAAAGQLNTPTPVIPGFVLYNSIQNDDLANSNLDNVMGNIQTGIGKYTNFMVAVVPDTFATASLNMGADPRNNLWFNLELEGQKYGIKSDSADKKQLVQEWKTYSGSVGKASYAYRMFLNQSYVGVQNAANPQTGDYGVANSGGAFYQFATKPKQYITYNRTLFNKFIANVDSWYQPGGDSNEDRKREEALPNEYHLWKQGYLGLRSYNRAFIPQVDAWKTLALISNYNYPYRYGHTVNMQNLFNWETSELSYFEYRANNPLGKGKYESKLTSPSWLYDARDVWYDETLKRNTTARVAEDASMADYHLKSPMNAIWWVKKAYVNIPGVDFIRPYDPSLNRTYDATLIPDMIGFDKGFTYYTNNADGKPNYLSAIPKEVYGTVEYSNPGEWETTMFDSNNYREAIGRVSFNEPNRSANKTTYGYPAGYKYVEVQNQNDYNADNSFYTQSRTVTGIAVPSRYAGLLKADEDMTAMDGSKLDIRNSSGTTYPSAFDTITIPRVTHENTASFYDVINTRDTWGSTNSRVALNKVTSYGMHTPSAIVIPELKKIYYFIYKYNTNCKEE